MSKEQYCHHVIQGLYNGLEAKVKDSPADWEYALCLHRWLASSNSTAAEAKRNWEGISVINLNANHVTSLVKGDSFFLVNTESSKGFKVPHQLVPVFQSLLKSLNMTKSQFSHAVAQHQYDPGVLLEQVHASGLVSVQ